ncbi:MAG TPA: biopolymer transporter ExbD [Tepidisphaeraceae bacterium]|nr:biopolymer transporter ExbD [Tepidisphaeraceae bacterium]
MKLRGAKQVHYDSGPNMTPLVDVVMVILIFLMLAGSFVGQEHFLVSNLPFSEQGTGSASPPPGYIPDEPLDIRVDRRPTGDGFIATAGQIRVDNNQDALTQQLLRLRKQLNAAGKPTDTIQVKINPAKDVPYKHLIAVYEAALRAQFERIAFATSH